MNISQVSNAIYVGEVVATGQQYSGNHYVYHKDKIKTSV